MRVNGVQIIFLCVILFLLVFNISVQFSQLSWCIAILKDRRIQSVGQEFIALRPYVNKIQGAGYISCYRSSHPLTDTAIMGPYQQAQFVLSPLMLDYFHPRDYRHIILQCSDQAMQKKIAAQLSARIILKTHDGILLLERGEQ